MPQKKASRRHARGERAAGALRVQAHTHDARTHTTHARAGHTHARGTQACGARAGSRLARARPARARPARARHRDGVELLVADELKTPSVPIACARGGTRAENRDRSLFAGMRHPIRSSTQGGGARHAAERRGQATHETSRRSASCWCPSCVLLHGRRPLSAPTSPGAASGCAQRHAHLRNPTRPATRGACGSAQRRSARGGHETCAPKTGEGGRAGGPQAFLAANGVVTILGDFLPQKGRKCAATTFYSRARLTFPAGGNVVPAFHAPAAASRSMKGYDKLTATGRASKVMMPILQPQGALQGALLKL